MITRTVDTKVRVPRGDSGQIRGIASQILTAQTEITDGILAVVRALEPPHGVEPIVTIELGTHDILITAHYTEDDDTP